MLATYIDYICVCDCWLWRWLFSSICVEEKREWHGGWWTVWLMDVSCILAFCSLYCFKKIDFDWFWFWFAADDEMVMKPKKENAENRKTLCERREGRASPVHIFLSCSTPVWLVPMEPKNYMLGALGKNPIRPPAMLQVNMSLFFTK